MSVSAGKVHFGCKVIFSTSLVSLFHCIIFLSWFSKGIRLSPGLIVSSVVDYVH